MIENIKCYQCGKPGHMKPNCPDNPKNKEGIQQMNDEINCAETENTGEQNMQVEYESEEELWVNFQDTSGMQCNQVGIVIKPSVTGKIREGALKE